MKRVSIAVLAASITVVSINASDDASVKQEGIKYIKMLGGALKTELKTHMKRDSSGLEALGFCTASAEKITDEVNAKLPKYAKVRRTALKVRNDKRNAPDETDIEVMFKYDAKAKEGALSPQDIEVVTVGDTTRIYKPLVTKKVCLKCHGSTLDPKITEALKGAYPKDHARGFKEGDLRGVIVAEIKSHH